LSEQSLIEDYVRVTARLLALPLADDQVARVATHLARTQGLAAGLQALDLPPELELAEVYCPAPFPPGDA
jgi:hypothetical protein